MNLAPHTPQFLLGKSFIKEELLCHLSEGHVMGRLTYQAQSCFLPYLPLIRIFVPSAVLSASNFQYLFTSFWMKYLIPVVQTGQKIIKSSVPEITGDDASFVKPGMNHLGRNSVPSQGKRDVTFHSLECVNCHILSICTTRSANFQVFSRKWTYWNLKALIIYLQSLLDGRTLCTSLHSQSKTENEVVTFC